MGRQNTIVLNGKLYDAVTGAALPDPIPNAANSAAKAPKPAVKKRRDLVMDGVIHHSQKTSKAHKTKKHSSHNAPTANSHQKSESHEHRAAAPSHHRSPQKAAVLMRHAVSKPVHHTEHHREPATIHDERTAQRMARAQAIQKSHHIQRFPTAAHPAHRSVHKKHVPLDVESAPELEQPAKHQPAHHAKPDATVMSESEKLVTNALKNARAHEATAPFAKKPKRRLSHKLGFQRRAANMAMAGMAILVLTGFFVYQNIPNLSMRLASTRAGFAAGLPSYQPTGFSQNKLVTYSPGKVTISFHSNSDERQYRLTQQVSNWNSQALVDNYLATADKPYQTYQQQGRTVYIYDDGNATWVNGGVWYQIDGKSSLTSDQLLKIAASI